MLGRYPRLFVFSAHLVPFLIHMKKRHKSSPTDHGPEGKRLQEAFLSCLTPGDTLGQLFDVLPNVYFFVKDTEGRFMRMNQALLQAIGFRQEAEVLGFTDADFFSPFLAQGYREEDRWIASNNKVVRDKIWFVPNSKGDRKSVV